MMIPILIILATEVKLFMIVKAIKEKLVMAVLMFFNLIQKQKAGF